METSQLENDESTHHRRTKFTPQNIRQIINLVERGTSPAQIAEIIGVTLGTLKTTCSKLHISLRPPSYDTGTGLLRHRRRPIAGTSAATAGSPRKHPDEDAPNEQPAVTNERQPMEQEPTLVPQDKASPNHGPLATLAIVMQYKGEKHASELSLTHDMLGQLEIEAEFRAMKSVELIARAIEAIAKGDHFDLVLGNLRSRSGTTDNRAGKRGH
jgi:hypothetical protein